MNYNDDNIGALDNICPGCNSISLGTLLDGLNKTLTDGGKYEGELLTAEQVSSFNNICPVVSNVKLGTIINNVLNASKTSDSIDSLDEETILSLNTCCPGFAKAQIGTLINECITKISSTPAPSKDTDILTFTIPSQEGESVISAESHTVNITVPTSTPLDSVIATFTLSTGATAKVGDTAQVSGTTPNNFTSPVTYTITAEDTTTTQNWSVTVTEAGE